MWTTPLSANSVEPASHYISSGYIPEQFASLLTDPVAVYEAAIAQGVTCTLKEVEEVLSSSDISEEEPFVAMGRMGLKIINPSEIL